MPISSTDTQEMEESKLPSLFVVSGYRVFFWSNEEGEPIHVHVCKGRPSPNATKLWLTKTGGCIVASNGSGIPPRELRELTEFVSAQFFMICAKWKEFFVTDEIKFYCWFIPLFLSPISVLNFDSYAAEEYGRIRPDLERKGTTIGPMDIWICWLKLI